MHDYIINEKIKNYLNNYELNSLLQANNYLNNKEYFFALHEFYNIFYSNILRRIESYDYNYFINKLKTFDINENNNYNIIKKWENFNVNDILNLSKKIGLINDITYNIFISFIIFKNNTLTTDEIDLKYLLSYYNILNEELLCKEMQINENAKVKFKRRKSDNLPYNRRQNDNAVDPNIIIDTKKLNPKILANKFENNNKQDNNNLNYDSIYV